MLSRGLLSTVSYQVRCASNSRCSPTWYRMVYCAAAPNLSALTRRWPRASSARVCAPPRNPEFVIDSLISGSFLRRVVNVVPSSSAAAGRGFAALPAAPSPPDWSVNPFHPRRSPPRLRGRNALLQHHDLGPLPPHPRFSTKGEPGWGEVAPDHDAAAMHCPP